MRLINVYTKRFEEFYGEIPAYAILSHTWQDYEIPFKDFDDPEIHASHPEASRKIHDTCDRAFQDELDYVWIDSCCIDKRSSAELSESINSMYNWYANAQICYAYISDYDESADSTSPEFQSASNLAKCRWFTRGWTLQELLAPRRVNFYDKNWTCFGTRQGLATTVAEITDIPKGVLEGNRNADDFCVAQKMAWAAKRRTTREEDIAYCLFGLFQINAPLLYGEGGERAFQRLQEEIIKKTNDLTILAWMDMRSSSNRFTSVLASHPWFFSHSHHIQPQISVGSNPEFRITNKGLKIRTLLHRSNDAFFFMPLNCIETTAQGFRMLNIFLVKRDGVFFRTISNSDNLAAPDRSESLEELIYIATNIRGRSVRRNVALAIPLEDGTSQSVEIQAQIDYKYPFNLINGDLAQEFPIAYTRGRRQFLVGGRTFHSRGYFEAMYVTGQNDISLGLANFTRDCGRAHFEIVDTEPELGYGIVFGQPAIEENYLLIKQTSLPYIENK